MIGGLGGPHSAQVNKKTARRPAAVWPVPRQRVVQARMLRMSLLALMSVPGATWEMENQADGSATEHQQHSRPLSLCLSTPACPSRCAIM